MVLYNGERPWDASTRLRDLIALPQQSWLDDFQVGVRYHLVDEQRYPREQLQELRSVVGLILELEQCRDEARGRELVKALAGPTKLATNAFNA